MTFLVTLVVSSGLYFSYRLGWKPITSFFAAVKFLGRGGDSSKNSATHISPFVALATVIGGNLGTGNLSSVAVALSTGGPGAIVWMVIITLLTSSIKYASCYLGIQYRLPSKSKGYVGGPMYYLEKVTPRSRSLSILFSISLLLGALTVGNLVQVNSITLQLAKVGIPPLYGGIPIALLVGMVVRGGLRFFAKMITIFVSFMTILYLLMCLYVLIMHCDKLLGALKLLFVALWVDIQQALGGGLGCGVVAMLRVGTLHGIFATDTGLGLEAIIHSNVHQIEKKEQALISALSPLIVTFLCRLTALVLLVTGVWQDPHLESTNMCFEAFKDLFGASYGGAPVGTIVILFCLYNHPNLAFFAEKAVNYLFPNSPIPLKIGQAVFVLLLPVGALLQVNFLWSLAHIAIELMLLFNLLGLFFLAKKVD